MYVYIYVVVLHLCMQVDSYIHIFLHFNLLYGFDGMCEILVVSRGSSYATCKMLETRRCHVTRGVQPSTMDGRFPLGRYTDVVLVRERITEICSPNHQVKKVKKASKPHGGLENDLCFHEKDVRLPCLRLGE